MEHIGRVFGCTHGGAVLAREMDNSGWRVGLYCEACDRWVRPHDAKGYWYAHDHPAVAAIGAANLPIRGAVVVRMCEACGCLARCQKHHYGVRQIFGREADRWPQGWLCVERIVANEWADRPTCHREWHDIMTPGLMGAYDPAAHADILARWLSAAQLNRLADAIAGRAGAA